MSFMYELKTSFCQSRQSLTEKTTDGTLRTLLVCVATGLLVALASGSL